MKTQQRKKQWCIELRVNDRKQAILLGTEMDIDNETTLIIKQPKPPQGGGK